MDTNLSISIVAAVAKNDVIGWNNEIPWNIPRDLRHFKRLTKGHTVIVGRKTYRSIIERLGHPLTDRLTIVITRQQNFPAPKGCQAVTSWKEALEKARGKGEVFVIGGAEIYRLAIPYAQLMYITKIHTRCSGNAFFPIYNISEWQEIYSQPHTRDEENEYDYTFTILKKKRFATGPKKESESFVNLKNARVREQYRVMKVAQKGGFCPFCFEHASKSQLEPIIKQGKYWHIRKNRWPYKNTQVHLILIYNTHVEKLSEISPDAAKEFFNLTKWIEEEYQIPGGAIGLRFGDIYLNGGTVLHLHAHIITANIINRDDPDYLPVRFRMG